jgi:hypothetical protein
MGAKWRAQVVMPPHVVAAPGERRIHALLQLTNTEDGEELAISLNLTRADIPRFTAGEGFELPLEAEEAARELWDWYLTADNGKERKALHELRDSK